jgi:hypothetical protein
MPDSQFQFDPTVTEVGDAHRSRRRLLDARVLLCRLEHYRHRLARMVLIADPDGKIQAYDAVRVAPVDDL